MMSSVKKQELHSAVQQSLRLLLSIVLSSFIAYLCGLNEPYWALITAVIVTQGRIVQTLETSRDQLVGSLIGGAAGIIAIAIQEYLEWSSLVVFTLVIIPMVAFVSWRPSMRLGVVTLAVVFLFPSPGGAFERPFDRIFSIIVGILASLIASYCILRPQARCSAFVHARNTFDKLHILLHSILTSRIPWDDIEIMNDQLTSELRDLSVEIAEARKEHPHYSLEHSDPILVNLFPILRRLQSDSIFVARAIDEYDQRLPYQTQETLKNVFDQIFRIFIEFCDEQSEHQEPFFSCDKDPNFDELIATILTEAKEHCPPTIQFTLEALSHDLTRGHDLFIHAKEKRAFS